MGKVLIVSTNVRRQLVTNGTGGVQQKKADYNCFTRKSRRPGEKTETRNN
jgi:hypothetical protein